MTWHRIPIILVRLEDPKRDMESPSRFVRDAQGIPGVLDAFRVLGRFDAVVVVMGDSPEEAVEAVQAVKGHRNVRDAEVLVAWPGYEPPHRA